MSKVVDNIGKLLRRHNMKRVQWLKEFLACRWYITINSKKAVFGRSYKIVWVFLNKDVNSPIRWVRHPSKCNLSHAFGPDVMGYVHFCVKLYKIIIFVFVGNAFFQATKSFHVKFCPNFDRRISSYRIQKGIHNYNRKSSPLSSRSKFTRYVVARCLLLRNHRQPRNIIIVDYFILEYPQSMN